MRHAAIFALAFFASPANASWLSEITGIDIDLNRGSISVKPPNIEAIPGMLENLPKDIAQAALNPAGNTLAAAIRFSRGQALNRGVEKIPDSVVRDLAPYFPAHILQKAKWTTAGGISIDGILANIFNQEGAVTLDEVIVFSSRSLTNDISLWAHELTHVLQYNQLGVETFAFQYSIDFNSFEEQARNNSSAIMSSIASTRNGHGQSYQLSSVEMGSQIAWSKVNTIAQSVIDPISCIWIDASNNITGNKCPIPIWVSGVVMVRLSDGARFNQPCNEPTCIFMPLQSGPLLSPWGFRIVGVTAAYK